MVDNYEQLIGFGSVLTVQDNGLIQVLIRQIDESNENIWDDIIANNNIVLQKIIVKPTLPSQLLAIKESL